jgi:hypothetical protein
MTAQTAAVRGSCVFHALVILLNLRHAFRDYRDQEISHPGGLSMKQPSHTAERIDTALPTTEWRNAACARFTALAITLMEQPASLCFKVETGIPMPRHIGHSAEER